MCEPTWIFASFQSTSDPFIQILPVSGKAIVLLLCLILSGDDGAPRMSRIQATETRRLLLLGFPAKRALRSPGLQRLAAVPAEAGLPSLARAQARLNLGDVRVPRYGTRRGAA